MKKLILIKIILTIVFSISVSAYTLIDYENFENYTAGDHTTSDFLTYSGTQWNCTLPSQYPDCERALAGGGTGYAGWIIINESSNKYLRVYAVGGQNNDYRESSLSWDITNSPSPTNNNGAYFLKMRMRLDAVTLSGFSGNELLDASGRIQASTSNFYGVADYAFYGFGSVLNTSSHDRLRIMYDFDRMKPDNSACEIPTDRFADVVIQHYYNDSVSGYLTNTKVYVDGLECMDYVDTNDQSALGSVFTNFIFKSIGAYSVEFDNIALYYGEISESEILSEYFDDILLDCPYTNCIFFDDFDNYDDDYNLSYVGYTGSNYNISDDKIFISGNLGYDINPYNYDKVQSNYFINIKEDNTPSSLQNQTFIYSFQDYCGNGNKVSDVYLLFTYPENKTGITADSKTEIYVYVKNPYEGQGQLQLTNLGSFYIDNGDIFGINRYYDFSARTYTFSIINYNNIIYGYLPNENLLTFNFNAVCDYIDNFVIEKIGTSNVELFYGIDEINYIGNLEGVEVSQYVYEHSLNITQEENLKNIAYALGFKDSIGMSVFWLGLTIVFIIIAIQSNIPPEGKAIACIFIMGLSTLSGYLFGFLGVQYVIILVFLVALATAFMISKIMSSNSSS